MPAKKPQRVNAKKSVLFREGPLAKLRQQVQKANSRKDLLDMVTSEIRKIGGMDYNTKAFLEGQKAKMQLILGELEKHPNFFGFSEKEKTILREIRSLVEKARTNKDFYNLLQKIGAVEANQ